MYNPADIRRTAPKPGDLVVFRLGDEPAMLRKLISEGGQRYLRASNQQYPMTEVTMTTEFIGVVMSFQGLLRH